MSSGNFVIGEDLSIDGFNKYIRPGLEKYKTEITDFTSYSDEEGNRILVSLIGDASPSALENTVKLSLQEAHPIMDEDTKKDFDKAVAWAHQIKKYPKGWLFDTLGIYQDSTTASKVFQNLAVKYSLVDLENKLEEASENISDFGKRFKNF